MRLIIFCFIFSLNAHAFINIESLRQSNQIGHLGSFGMRASGEIGNAEKFRGSINILNGHLSDTNEVLVIANYYYGRSLGLRDTNNGQLHIRNTILRENSFDIEVFTQSQFNEFTSLKHRFLAGSNLRFKLIKTQKSFFYLGTGAFWEKLERDNNPNKDGLRGNIYLSYLHKFNQRVEASVTGYYQPYIDKISDNWINLAAALSYSLTQRLSFVADIKMRHESKQPGSIKTTDIYYLTGINYRY